MNEWGFTGEVKSWIDQIAKLNPQLPFRGARIEQVGSGSRKRRDLTIIGEGGEPLITGELKLPDAPDGGSPYRADVVQDAQRKALRAGVKFFFTWNVNECVLWETATAGAGLKDRAYERWVVAALTNREQLDATRVQALLHEWLVKFLHDAAKILHLGRVGGVRTPDIKFVEALESALTVPIRHTQEELAKLYVTKPTVRRDLDQWMLSLGWTIVADTEGVQELLERAAKFGCYLFVNKLVFHEALLKKYGKSLAPLNAPPDVTSGDDLQMRLQHFFAEAKEVTGDYETIFGDDPKDMGRRIPFYSNAAVPGWRSLIDQIHEFDFSKLDYEVVGSIFERLIGPEERHKYGQFYTRVEVVDLINSFCIATGDSKVMDPACGGGTFLVRAYARKKVKAGSRSHRDLLTDLYGIDISQFAAHLTTMNLATRDLVEDENYPRVGRSDFFNVLPDSPFVKLPQKLKAGGLGATYVNVSIPPLDAVIANPPYVRQEDIPKAKKKPKDGGPEGGTKEFYSRRVEQMAGAKLAGRSDLHCYFWPHAATFLKQGGLLGFITSTQWLDVEYGFHLQRWLLENFEILAVLETPIEPWFVGARVATAVTIARRCDNAARRDLNTVRFVQLRKPIADLLESDGTTLGSVLAADSFRDELLALTEDVSHKRYRARLVNQGELWRNGVELGRLLRGEVTSDEDAEISGKSGDGVRDSGTYFGGKWGVYLRAPDLWFHLIDRFRHSFIPLGELAEIRFGVKSGKDEFFYPKDASAQCLESISDPVAFENEYGVPRSQVESGMLKLILAGDKRGELHAIESEYLEPEVHSLMEVRGFIARESDCSRLIFLAPTPKPQLKKFAKAYVVWGEHQGVDKGSTCAQRVTKDRDWYDLTGHRRGIAFWPKAQQYKHAVPLNSANLQANCNLYDLFPIEGVSGKALTAVLNSTLAILAKHQFGRLVGVEGNLKTEIVDVSMMLVPDIRQASKKVVESLERAMDAMTSRDPLQMLSERRMRRMTYQKAGRQNELEQLSNDCELDMPDRRALDMAVLELLGMKTARERDECLNALYSFLKEFFEETRQKEEQAIYNKGVTSRKGAVSPQELAAQLVSELNTQQPMLFQTYKDFFQQSAVGNAWIAREVPRDGTPQLHADMHDVGIRFMRGNKAVHFVSLPSKSHAELAVVAINEMRRETVQVPRDERDCEELLRRYANFITDRNARLRAVIADRVADEDVQEAVFGLLLHAARRGARAPVMA
jgi:methylase of polypeptide subunit release factors